MPKEEWSKSTFGARLTYERILPYLVKEPSPGAIYWPGFPFSSIDNNSDRTIEDVHIWNCKASSYERRMLICIGENVRLLFDLETYVYLS